MIKKAMILAAGVGSRLMPYTEDKPKALVELQGVPLIDFQIKKLIAGGFTHILVNVHHWANMLCEHIHKSRFDASIEFSDERDKLLDTGGAVKRAAWFFRDVSNFLVINVDVITNLDLHYFMQKHQASNALSTIAVRDRITSRYLLFDENGSLCGWKNIKTGEERMIKPNNKQGEMAFSGIHCMSSKIFRFFPAQETFSIIDAYLGLAAKHEIKAFPHQEDFWADAGKAAEFNRLNKDREIRKVIKLYTE
ncbi:MAG: NTP transferase domain-containing protein [Bacteroidales bacterium]|nr:NTP transferase domain-containing protein [Bacteroidales bacterium]MCF8344727.1 NTP transferase domain-containing protein [Bacteroidales bacterium]MCF8352406.1 NTP transferase domain-containing protein [Bacteroidales bacterium]MCF8375227.1 NTP transferase domain-containing protein [Bacteroidales bacterium]MCF8400251.1 NTP transferase domain-containing protein [Bacteroidales bacterium]